MWTARARLRKFFESRCRMLSPIILFNTIMQTIGAFMTFMPAFIISKGEGGPMDGTLLYSLYLFRQAFMFFNMGYASAMAWVMLLWSAILTAHSVLDIEILGSLRIEGRTDEP